MLAAKAVGLKGTVDAAMPSELRDSGREVTVEGSRSWGKACPGLEHAVNRRASTPQGHGADNAGFVGRRATMLRALADKAWRWFWPEHDVICTRTALGSRRMFSFLMEIHNVSVGMNNIGSPTLAIGRPECRLTSSCGRPSPPAEPSGSAPNAPEIQGLTPEEQGPDAMNSESRQCRVLYSVLSIHLLCYAKLHAP